jgi:hypothetical protein
MDEIWIKNVVFETSRQDIVADYDSPTPKAAALPPASPATPASPPAHLLPVGPELTQSRTNPTGLRALVQQCCDEPLFHADPPPNLNVVIYCRAEGTGECAGIFLVAKPF